MDTPYVCFNDVDKRLLGFFFLQISRPHATAGTLDSGFRSPLYLPNAICSGAALCRPRTVLVRRLTSQHNHGTNSVSGGPGRSIYGALDISRRRPREPNTNTTQHKQAASAVADAASLLFNQCEPFCLKGAASEFWTQGLISKLATVLFISGNGFNTFHPVLQFLAELADAMLAKVSFTFRASR